MVVIAVIGQRPSCLVTQLSSWAAINLRRSSPVGLRLLRSAFGQAASQIVFAPGKSYFSGLPSSAWRMMTRAGVHVEGGVGVELHLPHFSGSSVAILPHAVAASSFSWFIRYATRDPQVAPGSSATGADASHGHDSPHAHPPQIFGASVATWPHAVMASLPSSSMRYCTRFPHVASALPSTGADAYHSHAAPHLLLSPSVWPKRGLRNPPWPTAPAARTNRRAVALIISAEVLSLRFLLPESQWPVFQRGLKDRAIKPCAKDSTR
mmetsp:Transcript_2357/g.6649  ORF Transcript_2357/g.6649 Transcript_2357/m.6649 type:complete len:265 (+) Transcript_2357:580-1374(+)